MESAAGIERRSSSAPFSDHPLDRSSSSTIDCLTDELIVHILSSLSTKDAATTSILSRRWRHLWKLTGRVHLSIPRLSSVDLALSSFVSDPVSFPLRELSIEDPLLSFHRTIADSARRWISFAIDDLDVQVLSFQVGAKYLFPPPSSCKRNHKLTHLKLSFCKLRPNFEEFRNLKSISLLKGSTVTESALESINLNCTLLESLEISEICGITNLRVSSSLCHLKYLKLDCSEQALFIESPNLEHFEYYGNFPKQAYQLFAPRLKVLSLPCEGRTFSSTVALLQSLIIGELDKLDLHLHPQLTVRDFDDSRPSPLNHVKELSLTIVPMGKDDLGGLVAFLRASSSLEVLKLFLFQWWPGGLPDMGSGDSGSCCSWKHQSLRKIRINWFNCSSIGHLSLLKCLVEVAVRLEEIEIVLEVGSSSEDLSESQKCIEDCIGGDKLLRVSIP